MKNIPRISHRKGMSAAEMLVASTIAVIVIAAILLLTEFSQYIWKNERARSNLMGKLEAALEKMQKEIRFTDGNQVFYYPDSAATYTAISFPAAVDSNGDGFIEVTTGNPPMIAWGQTVIYHTYANPFTGKTELRRTLFTQRASMTGAQRQQQLDDVAANGHPTLTSLPEYSSWNSTTGTRAICDGDNLTLTVTPTLREFDGYSASTARSENVTFGSAQIDSGEHHITFKVIGQNSHATGFRMGIDSFSVTPSGCVIEAEDAPVDEDGGGSKVNEDMSAYGSWSGRRHLEYQAAGVDDFISLDIYYDQWLETNFATSSPYYTSVEYGNRTGDGGECLGAGDYVVRLGGYGDSWSALAQTGALAKSSESFDTGTAGINPGINFRNVIMSKNVDVEGRAAKITFDNTQNLNSLTIDYASLMTRSATNSPDGDAATVKQIRFSGATSATIAAGSSAESDWVDINNFDRSKDYLLTFHIPSSGSHNISSWPVPGGDPQDSHSYTLEGDTAVAQDPNWSARSPTASDTIYTIDSIDASYFSGGKITSQIYDTGVADPAYSTLKWGIAKDNYDNFAAGGLGADLIIRVRSGDDPDALKAALDWSGALSINTTSGTPLHTLVSGSANISGIGTGRYVQFQAEFFSQPAPGACDYLKSCVLKNLSISWPGQERIVDISGYFTRRPDYGIFTVMVDDHVLIKGLEVNLAITENTSGGRSVTKYLTVEAEPRNTGK